MTIILIQGLTSKAAVQLHAKESASLLAQTAFVCNPRHSALQDQRFFPGYVNIVLVPFQHTWIRLLSVYCVIAVTDRRIASCVVKNFVMFLILFTLLSALLCCMGIHCCRHRTQKIDHFGTIHIWGGNRGAEYLGRSLSRNSQIVRIPRYRGETLLLWRTPSRAKDNQIVFAHWLQ